MQAVILAELEGRRIREDVGEGVVGCEFKQDFGGVAPDIIALGKRRQVLTAIRLLTSHFARISPASRFEHSLLPMFRFALCANTIQSPFMKYIFSSGGGFNVVRKYFEPCHRSPLTKKGNARG